jgi:hypothetical protein
VTLHEHHALLVEQHGTQGNLFGAEAQQTTARKSFFRRLHEAKRPDLAIDYEVVLCMKKPLTAAAVSQESGVDACLTSPPYAESLSEERNGIDWSRAEGGTRNRTREANYAKNNGSGITAQFYGYADGQLGQMKPGSLDACLSSPPYADQQVGTGGAGRTGWRGYTDHGGGTGATAGQLAAMVTGTPPGQEVP